MRTSLRRAATLVVTAVALALSATTTVAAGPAAADPVCQPGSNWDGVLKICR